MNLLILFPEDFISLHVARLTDRRLQHLLLVKKISQGEILEVGLLNDKIGHATIMSFDNKQVLLEVQLSKEAIAPLSVHLILALPRPKMLKRILQTISAMGVKRLTLIHSAKVEKSYWQTPWLEEARLRQHLLLGLEQAKDTLLPRVDCFQHFKPFAEDVLPELISGTRALVAHPGKGDYCLGEPGQPVSLAIGPEGGFTEYEIKKFSQAGFAVCHIGERILRVENAIPVLLGRFSY